MPTARRRPRPTSTALAAALAACAALVSSCGPPVSVNPLSDRKTAERDDRLNGAWMTKFKEAGEEQDCYILFAASKGKTTHIMTVGAADDGFTAQRYEMFVSVIGGVRYMNAWLVKTEEEDGFDANPADEPRRYYICKYDVSKDGLLRMWVWSDGVAKAIEAGELKGKVVRGQYGTSVTVTDTAKAIAKVLADAKHKKLFEPLGDFKRLRPLAPEAKGNK